MSIANGDSIELKSWVKFWIEVSGIQREMWAFVTPKNNPNVSLLLGLHWLRSIDAKLYIQKKEIHIGDSKKREAIFQIPCSTTASGDTHFQASTKHKANVDESSDEEHREHEDGSSIEGESDDESSDQGF